MSGPKHAIESHFQTGLIARRRTVARGGGYRLVLASEPAHADSLHMLGVVATQCGQPEATLAREFPSSASVALDLAKVK